VVMAPPTVPGGTFRILEKFQWRGLDFEAQADKIKSITENYNVVYMGIDGTGMGQGVFQLVSKFFPQARSIQYDLPTKVRMVLKAQSVISKGRLEFDAQHVDIAHAFMAIKKTLTGSGRAMTYEAGRNDETGHADLAWAVMHVLDNEPLEGMTHANTSYMEFS
jgi:Terminase RNaseH-like domain